MVTTCSKTEMCSSHVVSVVLLQGYQCHLVASCSAQMNYSFVTVVLKALKTVKASKLANFVRCKRAVVKVELQVPRVSSETRLGRVSSSLRVFKLKFSR